MTPKEKAKELTIKYYNNIHENSLRWEQSKWEQSKQCVLICVDEFIDALDYNSSPTAEGLTEYYTEVKQEINKL